MNDDARENFDAGVEMLRADLRTESSLALLQTVGARLEAVLHAVAVARPVVIKDVTQRSADGDITRVVERNGSTAEGALGAFSAYLQGLASIVFLHETEARKHGRPSFVAVLGQMKGADIDGLRARAAALAESGDYEGIEELARDLRMKA